MLPRAPRQPALPVAVCFAAGICCDHWLGAAYATWLAAGAAGVVGWLLALGGRHDRAAAACLLGSVVAVGGLAHHATSRVLPPDHVALFASDERKLVRLSGTVLAAPEVYSARARSGQSAWRQRDMTHVLLECRELHAAEGTVTVSGRVRLRISGRLQNVTIGDVIEVVGWLARPAPPLNPGEFDYREHLRRQGLRALVTVEQPDAVQVVGHEGAAWWSRRIHAARERCLASLERHVSERNRPVAAALLLGDRTAMTDELRETFAESGMMHVLAISGLHVGILALFFWCGCRLLNLSPSASALVVLVGVVSYALFAHARPPIVRATIFVVLVMAGRPWHRRPGGANLLALAALVILAWRPTDLFDTGTQLSFLAVTAILFWGRVWTRIAQPDPAALALAADLPRWRAALRSACSWLMAAYTLTGCIWLVTLPLIAARFHIVSAVGLGLNVLLAPVVLVVLWVGYLFVGAALALPWLAAPLGGLLDRLLSFLLGVVDLAAGVDLGHRYVPGPGEWWLAGFYGLVVLVIWITAAGRHGSEAWLLRRTGFSAAGASFMAVPAWLLVGLSVGLVPARPEGLRCTFVAVGHGGAVLVEFPDGKTLLYDAGALDNARRAARVVQGCLWARGRDRLDAIVVSHADLDHFNAVPELVEALPVGCVLVSPSFFDLQQREVANFCDAVARAGVPLRSIGRGDRLRLDSRAVVTVVQPGPDERFSTDNANSVVVLVEYAGRRILLTGDIEDDGLDRLVADRRLDVDVALAPHHGSLRANTIEFAEWATPEHVVVSRGPFAGMPQLAEIYGEQSRVYLTAEDGAVTVHISRTGELRCETFR